MESQIPPEAKHAFDLALECERQGDRAAALAHYLDALEHAPDDLEIAYRTATSLLREGFLDEAASQLRRIVFVDPDHVPARANLGNCQLLLNDLPNAEQNFRAVLEAAPTNHNALYGLATVCLKQGKPADALLPAETLLDLIPNSAPALTLYAQATSRDPQSSRAAASFRKALSIDPGYLPALTGLAELSIRRKKFHEALDYARSARQLAPTDPDTHRLIALAQEHLGDLFAAEHALETALACATGNRPDIRVALSGLKRRQGQNGAALVHADAAWQLEPGRRDAGNALGASLKALGQSNVAREVLTGTAQNKPLSDDLLDRIAALVAHHREEFKTASADDGPSDTSAEAATEDSDAAPSGDTDGALRPDHQPGPDASGPASEDLSPTDHLAKSD